MYKLERQIVLFITAFWIASIFCSSAMGQSANPQNFMTRAAGSSIHSFSTEYGAGWVADNLVPTDEQLRGPVFQDPIWSSGASEPFPHWVVIDLGQNRWLTQFVFDNSLSDEADHPGISARHLTVLAGMQPDALKEVASLELERNKDGQAISVEPIEARYVKFLMTSNWGHPWYTELGPSMAFDDGRRPGDLSVDLLKDKRVDLYGIYFDFNSAELRVESSPTLNQLLRFLVQNSEQKLLIEGHTDAVGGDAANLTLSQRRAEAVVSELIKRGASRHQLSAVGFGASKPLATNANELGRSRNRRVSVALSGD